MFARWLVAGQHPVTPEKIPPNVIRTWLTELVATRSAATARTRWNGLRSFFKWCVAEGELDVDPMTNIAGPTVEEKVVDLLTDDQVRDLLRACQGPEWIDKRDEALILMYADTGARLSELARLDVGDVDLRERVAKVMGKGRRERWVPFGARTASGYVEKNLLSTARQFPY